MSLYKRGKIWWMSFNFDGKHIQKSTRCKSKREAEIFERAYRTQMIKGEVGIKPKEEIPSFSTALNEFLSWVEVEHKSKPNTIRSYKSRSFAIRDFFNNIPLNQIDAGDVERFKEFRAKQNGKPRTESASKEDKKKLSILKPATINRELALLKILFNYFIKRDIIFKNPVSQVKLLKEDNIQMRVVSYDEEDLYLSVASQPLKDFATIIIDSGMRPEEVARIEKKNINFEKGYLINPFGKTKSAKRKIYLTTRIKEILLKRINESENEFIFATEATGKPITTLKRSHATALRNSRVRKFRLYDLRHTFATRFLESGGDLISLAGRLGHSSIQMVSRYAHPSESHQFEAIKRMEQARINGK